MHYLHLHMDCIDTRCGHLSAKCNIDHGHTSRSKSIISMVTVGSYRQMYVYTPYLWVTLSVVLFRWHSCVHVASIPVSHSLHQATRFRTLPILLSLLDNFYVQRSISSLVRPTADTFHVQRSRFFSGSALSFSCLGCVTFF